MDLFVYSKEVLVDEIKWRNRKLHSKKNSYDIKWCYKQLECGYYVVLVNYNGLIGASYCAPDDAEPHWNPQKSIELAFARRSIKESIVYSIEGFIMTEYLVLGGFAPHQVVREIRKIFGNNIVLQPK